MRDVVGGIAPLLDAEHGALTRAVLLHYEGTSGGVRLPPLAALAGTRRKRPFRPFSPHSR